MKTYKVYEIINSLGTVEYVGETSRELKERFKQHTNSKPTSGHGKFYKRQDVTIHEVARFNTRKEARYFEGQLKIEYGMEWTEKTCGQNTGKLGIGGKSRRKLTYENAVEIRIIYKNGNISTYKLAEQYGVSQKTIDRIIRMQQYINP